MTSKATLLMVLLLSMAALCFAYGLYELGRGHDLVAVLLCTMGGLSLRALQQAGRLVEGGR